MCQHWTRIQSLAQKASVKELLMCPDVDDSHASVSFSPKNENRSKLNSSSYPATKSTITKPVLNHKGSTGGWVAHGRISNSISTLQWNGKLDGSSSLWQLGWFIPPFFHVGQLSKSSPRSTAETRASNVFPSRRTRSCFSASSSAGSRSAIRKTEWGWGRWDEASISCERNYFVFTERLRDRNRVKWHNTQLHLTEEMKPVAASTVFIWTLDFQTTKRTNRKAPEPARFAFRGSTTLRLICFILKLLKFNVARCHNNKNNN